MFYIEGLLFVSNVYFPFQLTDYYTATLFQKYVGLHNTVLNILRFKMHCCSSSIILPLSGPMSP